MEDIIARNSYLMFSQSSNDTGVIVSWNATAPSEAESGTYKNFATWTDGALTINPISWLHNEVPAGPVPFAKEYMSPFGFRSVSGFAGAVVDNSRGLLIVTGVDESGYDIPLGGLLSRYHGADNWFFADSITQNINDRIAAFIK